jgi:hypothetical protein
MPLFPETEILTDSTAGFQFSLPVAQASGRVLMKKFWEIFIGDSFRGERAG